MTTLQHRSISVARILSLRSVLPSPSRSFSSDALVELQPGEIGMVPGAPQEHLRRNVIKRHTPILKVKSYANNFKWKRPPKSKETD